VAGDTGILWQNRGGAFSLDPGSPNALAPAKRPFYTLNPGIALEKGRPCLLYGTQGADGQPQTLSVILSRLIDHGLDPEEALAAPRFLLGRTFSDTRDSLKIESDVSEAVMTALAARGHALAPIPPRNPLAGQAGVIAIAADGLMRGAHDPRSDGQALGVADP
jgi:gamma-glutamyltranspeptidase/glutathione hydrolase